MNAAWHRFQSNRAALVSAIFLALLGALLLLDLGLRGRAGNAFLPAALTWTPDQLGDQPYQPPNHQHWLGTDVHGRDLLARLLEGARLSLLVGAAGAALSLVLGAVWGATAGYLGGRWDAGLMRAVDALYALPSMVLVLVLIALVEEPLRRRLGLSPTATRLLLVFAGLGAVSWLTMARIVRGQVASLRERTFVEASRALGAGPARILFRHILPNTGGVIIVYLMLTVPSVILYESFLSYLGLGLQPPQASLGSLIADGAANLNPLRVYWWLVVGPAGLLAAILLALNLVGDGLRDVLDPRQQARPSAGAGSGG